MILANDLRRQYELYACEYEEKAIQVLRSGWYVLGEEVKNFEKEWADYVGRRYCVGLASGLDALWISFRLLGITTGDEVIVSSNAYIACVMGITINGATPIFVEPDPYYNMDANKIENAITDRTKAILAVHLYGQVCNMDAIMRIADKYNLYVVEDCAQSHGSRWKGKMAGAFGEVGCFSFYPTKGCGAFGDGGCVVTDNEKLAEMFRIFRNYGSEKRYHNKVVGSNSRLDELQAGLLRIKLLHLNELNVERQRLAQKYLTEIRNPLIQLPLVRAEAYSTWHQFVIRCKTRDRLKNYLEQNGIHTLIHYPIPPHLSEAYNYLGKGKGCYPIAERYAEEVLSIPMYNGLANHEQEKIIEILNAYEQ